MVTSEKAGSSWPRSPLQYGLVPAIPQEAAKCPKAAMEGLLKQKEVSLNF